MPKEAIGRDDMIEVLSKDGTIIGFDRLGEGPPVVLVCGASTARSANAALAAVLARRFTVFNYDRRGRGDSGDTPPYAVEREVEDLDAVIAAAGGSAAVYGTSSGAALALEAAASGLAVTKLALWEPPFIVDGSRPRPPADAAATYGELVSAGRRGDAVEFFMAKVVGMPAEFVAEARKAPWWLAQEAMAHTLVYDATIMGDHSVPTQRVAAVAAPALVIDGAASPGWMHTTAQAVANLLPAGRYHTLEGQEHNVAAEALAPVLEAFFAGRNGTRP
jgi:hypothetical protein